jgi:hypothetical protein
VRAFRDRFHRIADAADFRALCEDFFAAQAHGHGLGPAEHLTLHDRGGGDGDEGAGHDDHGG